MRQQSKNMQTFNYVISMPLDPKITASNNYTALAILRISF